MKAEGRRQKAEVSAEPEAVCKSIGSISVAGWTQRLLPTIDYYYTPLMSRTLLDALAALFPDSSRTTLRQMLQAGRVRVSGEVEKDAKRVLGVGEEIDVSRKSVQRALPEGLMLLHEDD